MPGSFSADYKYLHARKIPRQLNFTSQTIPDCTRYIIGVFCYNFKSEKNILVLTSENTILKSKLGSSRTPPNIDTSKPCLMMGSSMIRDLEPIKPETLTIQSISGAKLSDINKHITDKSKTEPNKYETVYIVAGSIDCESESTPEEITAVAKQTIKNALEIDDKVVLSSILPRTDNPVAEQKGVEVNIKLKSLCEQTDKVKYCDNDGSFRLADGSINDALLMPQGHHLNYRGSEKLAKNLQIEAKLCRKQPTQQWRPQMVSHDRRPSMYSSRQPPLLPNPAYHHNRSTSIWNSQAFPAPTGVCTNCKLPGHSAYNCPRTVNVLCYKCRSTGHRQKDCLD